MRESVILIPVPEVEPIVEKWRRKYDPVSLHGIPAHITILFPFEDPVKINIEILKKLKEIFSKSKKFHFFLESINTFPGVIFLQPSNREKFIAITKSIVKVFPENPPYGGKYPNINPHLTIGQLTTGQKIEEIKKSITEDIQKKLPFDAKAKEVWLMEKYIEDWTIRYKIPFLK